MKSYHRITVLALILLPIGLFADISGIVRDSRQKPVFHALVRFVLSSDSTKSIFTYTDSLGKYSVKLPGLTSVLPGINHADAISGLHMQNVPNPFSKYTAISFCIQKTGPVELSIFSTQGKCVRTISSIMTNGIHSFVWDRTDNDGIVVGDGAYMYRIKNGLSSEERTMVVATGSPNGRSISLPKGSQANSQNALQKTSAAAGTYHMAIYGKGVYPLKSRNVAIVDGATQNYDLTYIDLWDSTRAILRDDFANCRFQFETTKQGRVAFLGGSVTDNPGWRDSVVNYLKQKFPQTTFDFIEAGEPSVGSIMHAFRLQKDVFNRGKVDLLFVDNVGNDTINYTLPSIRVRAVEGIVCQALRHNPNIDIDMLYIADDMFYAAVQAGKPINCVEDDEKSAWYYGASCNDDAQYVAERYTWAQFGGDVHPGPFGQGIYASSIKKLFDAAWIGKPSPTGQIAHYIPSMPFDTFSYIYGHFDSLKNAQLSTGWQYVQSWSPTDGAGTRAGFVNVPVLQATAPGSVLKLSFTGKVIGIVVTSGPDAGMLDCSIDNKSYGTIDQYTPWSGGLHLPWTFIFADTLSGGSHQLTLTTSTNKNSGSKGTACRIHRFTVNNP